MGIFFESQPLRPAMQRAIKDAYSADPDAIGDVNAMAQDKAREVTEQVRESSTFQTGRFLVALAIFALIAAGGLIADIADLADSSKALYGFAATILGVIVGFLGGEKSAS
jgi:hypothetical protein